MNERLLREMVRELLWEQRSSSIDDIKAAFLDLLPFYHSGAVPIEEVEDEIGDFIDTSDPKLNQIFIFDVDPQTHEDVMLSKSQSDDIVKSTNKVSSAGADIAKSGSDYEVELVNKLEAVGIKTAGVAGFTKRADVTIITPKGVPYGIEAKRSLTADMGSAALKYNPETHTLSVSNPDSPIGAEVEKLLKTIHSDTDFMNSIRTLFDAGFLQTKKSAVDLVAWKNRTGFPTQPGRSYRLGNNDLVARHYQAKRETAEYIQIRGWGLYMMNSKTDPLNLASLGVIPLSAPVSVSVKVAQKGSSTPTPGKMSSLSMSAKAKLMTSGMPKSGFDLDKLSDCEALSSHLGYSI